MNGSISVSIDRYVMQKLQGPTAMKSKLAEKVTLPGTNLVFKAASRYLKRAPFSEIILKIP